MVQEQKTLLLIPTYNEHGNVQRMVREITSLNLDVDILFVDDNSPDGTGKQIQEMAVENPRLHLLARPGKLGVGGAHLDGIRWAYQHGYERLLTMDCDFTHPPSSLKELLAESSRAPIVVGSRYLSQGSLAGWNLFRKLLTRLGHFLTNHLLNIPYDATGAFRAYDLRKIPAGIFDMVVSRGYSFFFESLYLLHHNHIRIHQIPIHLPPRTYGSSKMNWKEIVHSVRLLISLYLTQQVNKETLIYATPLVQFNHDLKDNQNWDQYWTDHRNSSRLLYDIIAAFYRKVIIRPHLNRFVRKYFRPEDQVLHAGCGSGQVDRDAQGLVHLSALDISSRALGIYQRVNPNFKGLLLHGSIFKMPLPAASLDGVYNLGVMEHFTVGEIKSILHEFHRVLRPGGKIILFWPPEFGASVLFLKSVKWFMEAILRKQNVQLHPDEISRVRSRRQMKTILLDEGFRLVRYSFGPLDLFTYVVVVGEKPTAEMHTAPLRSVRALQDEPLSV